MGTAHLLIVFVALFGVPTSAQWRVGNDGTVGGNSPGRACTFPFVYKGVTHNECITTDNKNVPWCSTTSNYDSFNQWANCKVTINATRTRRGNAGKSSCSYPYRYKGRSYQTCTTDDYFSNKPWCATSPNYERDNRWAECVVYPDIKTTGGNVPAGSQCNFPFRYRGQNIHGCISTNNNGVGWCATTDSYDNDGLWGNCVVTTLGGNTCPNGNTYSRAVNTLSYGGTGRANANSVTDCQAECDNDGNCIGFDWDYNAGVSPRCYIHFNRANFNQKETAGILNVDQYTLTDRCTTGPGGGGGPGGQVTTRGGNAGQTNRCSFPYLYNGHRYTSCNSQNWYTAWCGVTGDFGRDGTWGECSNIPTM